jgi:hypothetical protein
MEAPSGKQEERLREYTKVIGLGDESGIGEL